MFQTWTPSPFPLFSFITYQKQIVTDLNWNFNQVSTSNWLPAGLWCLCVDVLFFYTWNMKSDFWRPNMGRPLRMVKGYTVTFGRAHFISPQYGLVFILGMQLEIPNEAWVRYVTWQSPEFEMSGFIQIRWNSTWRPRQHFSTELTICALH